MFTVIRDEYNRTMVRVTRSKYRQIGGIRDFDRSRRLTLHCRSLRAYEATHAHDESTAADHTGLGARGGTGETGGALLHAAARHDNVSATLALVACLEALGEHARVARGVQTLL